MQHMTAPRSLSFPPSSSPSSSASASLSPSPSASSSSSLSLPLSPPLSLPLPLSLFLSKSLSLILPPTTLLLLHMPPTRQSRGQKCSMFITTPKFLQVLCSSGRCRHESLGWGCIGEKQKNTEEVRDVKLGKEKAKRIQRKKKLKLVFRNRWTVGHNKKKRKQ